MSEVVSLRGAQFVGRAVAPFNGHRMDTVCAGGANVIGAVADHDRVARVGTGEVERRAKKAGAVSLEGCMASSIPQARNGTLYLMCGGDRAVFARGALDVARWLRGRRGWFSMDQFLEAQPTWRHVLTGPE